MKTKKLWIYLDARAGTYTKGFHAVDADCVLTADARKNPRGKVLFLYRGAKERQAWRLVHFGKTPSAVARKLNQLLSQKIDQKQKEIKDLQAQMIYYG